MRTVHLLAMLPQSISMFLLFCTLRNTLSIIPPVRVAAGSLKSAMPKLSTSLMQLLLFGIFFPLSQAVTLLPLGVEALMSLRGRNGGAPIGLLLTLAECAGILFLYRTFLNWLGHLLQNREQNILESVTDRAA